MDREKPISSPLCKAGPDFSSAMPGGITLPPWGVRQAGQCRHRRSSPPGIIRPWIHTHAASLFQSAPDFLATYSSACLAPSTLVHAAVSSLQVDLVACLTPNPGIWFCTTLKHRTCHGLMHSRTLPSPLIAFENTPPACQLMILKSTPLLSNAYL